jgi:hypothetical protein
MGGLIQFVAYGAQDIYLTGNAQITLFKSAYRRHTNFAMESINCVFNGTSGLGTRFTALIAKNGDLVKDMWLDCTFSTLDSSNTPVYGLGNAMIKVVELEIGGQLIDRQYGEWLNIWYELTLPEGKRINYDNMVGNYNDLTSTNFPETQLSIPLAFWFNNNPGLALPLIALHQHEVRVNIELDSAANLSTNGTVSLSTEHNIELWVDYIFLDTDERRRMAQTNLEYLIEQVQFLGDFIYDSNGNINNSSSSNVELTFQHPVKELYWVGQSTDEKRGGSESQPCKFVKLHDNNTKFLIRLNGQDRFTSRSGSYFMRTQQFKHHTNSSRANRTLTNYVDDTTKLAIKENNSQYIYSYSFALNPEEHQPSGTCNFSRLDSAQLTLAGTTLYHKKLDNSTDSAGIIKVYAKNYNILRVMNGMAGLAYGS